MSMKLKAIREDLGHHVFEIACTCTELQSKAPWTFLINLDTEFPAYNPKTGIVRCPRCHCEAHAALIVNDKDMKVSNSEIKEEGK